MMNHLQDVESSVCPYLGLCDDPDTALTYPSTESYCHKVKPPTVPNLDQQLSVCLTGQYSTCQIFQSQTEQRMPKELTLKAIGKRRGRSYFVYLGILAFLTMVALIILLPYVHPQEQTEDIATISSPAPTETPLLPVGFTTQAATVELALPTETPFPSPQPTPTATPIETHKAHYLEEPFGESQRFIVHRVSPGESLLFLATQYNTTTEIIKAANYHLIVPIWVDSFIIIPLDRIELGDLPAFEAYQITENNITLRHLAERFVLDLHTLVSYNDIPADENLFLGEWILLPRESQE